MMKLVWYAKAIPASYICDPSVEFQPGMIAQLTTIGNQVMATVSNGMAPFGIIDEIRTKSFTSISWNEDIILPVDGVPNSSGQLVLGRDEIALLKNSNIVKSSFVSTVRCILNEVNGVVTFLAGTPLNFDIDGDGTMDSIRAIVNYTYYMPNMPGDDSTIGSGRMTVWYERMIFQTDQFETNQAYPLNAPLFCSEKGLFTSRKPSPNHPAIAMVTAPPSNVGASMLEVLWY